MASKRKRGRPRGSSNTKKIVRKIASEKHKSPKGYEARMMTIVELVLLALRNKAMQGHIEANQLFDTMREKYVPHTKIERTILRIQFVKPEAPAAMRQHDNSSKHQK